MKLEDWILVASEKLSRAGCESPKVEAELILAYLLNISRGKVLASMNHELPDDVMLKADDIVERRCATRKPLAYIIGQWDFFGLTFDINESVMVPRPETELLVEAVLGRLGDEPLLGVDIGTGCGNIAIALLVNRENWEIFGTDILPEALFLARANASKNWVGDRFFPVACDLAEAIKKADFIVCNPPYIPESEKSDLQKEVLFEPPQALFAGEDGMDVIKRLPNIFERLGAKFLAFEFGYGQAEKVRQIFGEDCEIIEDYSGIPRVAVVRRT